MDTVPADEPEWTSDPFTLVESDGHYYGRGVCDMKGFLALAVNAAASVRQENLQHPLVLVFTYDEEVGLLGGRHLAQEYARRGELPTAAIIGEPTSLQVVRMHKGFVGFRVVLYGKSAHSGYPHLGKNAIEPAGTLIQALKEFRHSLESESLPNAKYFPEVPFAALNVGTVNGGSAPNIVPDRCELACSLRTMPGTATGPMIRRVREVVEDTLANWEHEFIVTNETPPLLLDENTKIYEMLSRLVDQTLTQSASYATDAGWLQTLGMECAVFGPGNIEVAHRPNESMPMHEFGKCGTMLQQAIDEFCRSNS
jgi:acetylornithine deacetylase